MRTTAQIKASIRALCSSAAKMQLKFHIIAVECLEHAEQHGDATLMDYLVQSMPKGQRVEALVLWVENFSPIRWSGDRTNVGLLKSYKKGYRPFDVAGAKETPYFEFTKENAPPKPLTLEAIQAIIQRLPKMVKQKKEDGLVDPNEEPTISAYVAALQRVATPEAFPVN